MYACILSLSVSDHFSFNVKEAFTIMSGPRLYTGGSEMNDTVFAVSEPRISHMLFHLIFFNNALRYVSLPLFQRSRNDFRSSSKVLKVTQ